MKDENEFETLYPDTYMPLTARGLVPRNHSQLKSLKANLLPTKRGASALRDQHLT